MRFLGLPSRGRACLLSPPSGSQQPVGNEVSWGAPGAPAGILHRNLDSDRTSVRSERMEVCGHLHRKMPTLCSPAGGALEGAEGALWKPCSFGNRANMGQSPSFCFPGGTLGAQTRCSTRGQQGGAWGRLGGKQKGEVAGRT